MLELSIVSENMNPRPRLTPNRNTYIADPKKLSQIELWQALRECYKARDSYLEGQGSLTANLSSSGVYRMIEDRINELNKVIRSL